MPKSSATYAIRALFTAFFFKALAVSLHHVTHLAHFLSPNPASFLHASASSYRPVWDYLSTILTSSPSLLAPSLLPSDHPGMGIGGLPGNILGAFSDSRSWE